MVADSHSTSQTKTSKTECGLANYFVTVGSIVIHVAGGGTMSQPSHQTLTIHLPFVLKMRGGRKEMIVPPGVQMSRMRCDYTVIKALARAFRWRRMLDGGEFATIGELAAHENIAPSYMTRVMRLTLLAPNIVDGIIAGRMTLELAVLLEPLPVEWAGQVAAFRL